MNEATKTPDLKDRLERARREKEKRDGAAAERAMLREVEVLELEERLTKEIGPRGSLFDLVETSEGPIAFRLGESVLHKRFRESKQGEVDIHDFVFPCIVHPEKEKYLEIVGRRPGVAIVIANKLADLFAARVEDEAGKR